MNEILSPFSDLHEEIQNRRVALHRKRESKRMLGSTVQILVVLAVLLCIFLIFFRFRIAKGNGMYPAVLDGDLVLCFHKSEFVKNDIVFYTVNGTEYLGRVAAVGGDILDISDEGVLTVNGTVQAGEIDFPTFPADDWDGAVIVPPDSVFVLGDYRTQTRDSRDFGCIPLKDVKWKAVTILRHRKL